MEGTLKVTPAKLKETAQNFSGKAGEVQTLHEEMLSKIKNLSGVWTGSASDAYLRKFDALKSSMDKINRMILEHSSDLTEMATQYETGEQQAVSLADELPASNLI